MIPIGTISFLGLHLQAHYLDDFSPAIKPPFMLGKYTNIATLKYFQNQ